MSCLKDQLYNPAIDECIPDTEENRNMMREMGFNPDAYNAAEIMGSFVEEGPFTPPYDKPDVLIIEEKDEEERREWERKERLWQEEKRNMEERREREREWRRIERKREMERARKEREMEMEREREKKEREKREKEKERRRKRQEEREEERRAEEKKKRDKEWEAEVRRLKEKEKGPAVEPVNLIAESTAAELIFNGSKETLKIIHTGGSLVSYLGVESKICPLIGSEIELVQRIGKGNFGTVFLIKFPGMGKKQYVVKKTDIEIDRIIDHKTRKRSNIGIDKRFRLAGKPKSWGQLSSQIESKLNINPGVLLSLNNLTTEDITELDRFYWLPNYAKLCRTIKDEQYPRSNGDGVTNIPTGSYICKNETYSEYTIGQMAAQLYRHNISINFIDQFAFATCPKTSGPAHYVFMEKISGETLKIINALRDKNWFDVFLIQTLFAISCYQEMFQISHNDLHDKNLFYEEITADTEYQGNKLYGADYFHYYLNGVDIYIPAIPYIAKVGDFGLSAKWSKPIVGSFDTISDGFIVPSQKAKGPWVPNWYAPSYDALFICLVFLINFMHSQLLRNVTFYIAKLYTGDDVTIKAMQETRPHLENRKTRGSRPNLSLLNNQNTAKDVLLNPQLVGKYYTRPSSGKIVTLGYLKKH
jgi:serine/threonine protein kinase